MNFGRKCLTFWHSENRHQVWSWSFWPSIHLSGNNSWPFPLSYLLFAIPLVLSMILDHLPYWILSDPSVRDTDQDLSWNHRNISIGYGNQNRLFLLVLWVGLFFGMSLSLLCLSMVLWWYCFDRNMGRLSQMLSHGFHR